MKQVMIQNITAFLKYYSKPNPKKKVGIHGHKTIYIVYILCVRLDKS